MTNTSREVTHTHTHTHSTVWSEECFCERLYLWLKDWRGCLLSLWLCVHIHGVRRVNPWHLCQIQERNSVIFEITQHSELLVDPLALRTESWYVPTPKWLSAIWELLSFAAPHRGWLLLKVSPFSWRRARVNVCEFDTICWSLSQAAASSNNPKQTFIIPALA